MTFSVLIIEDAKSLAASYADVLHKTGCKSDVAGDLTTARSKLKSGRYDAILLDMSLPDGDGLSVLRDMNADGSGSPIIAVTSDGSISRAIEATRLGAFDFLVKPVSKERLTQAVVSACRATPRRLLHWRCWLRFAHIENRRPFHFFSEGAGIPEEATRPAMSALA